MRVTPVAVEQIRTSKVPMDLSQHLKCLLHSSLWQLGPSSDTRFTNIHKNDVQGEGGNITFYLCTPKVLSNKDKCFAVLDSVRITFQEKWRLYHCDFQLEISVSDIHSCDRDSCQSTHCDYDSFQCNRPCLVLKVPVVNFMPHPNHIDRDKLSQLQALLLEMESYLVASFTSQLLVEGGDDRLFLNNSGVNKYYCPPYPVDPDTTLLRSSCTCSPPTKEGFERACAVVKQLWKQPELYFSMHMEGVRKRILKALKLNDIQTFCILHPSGSDAELLPLLVAMGRMERLDAHLIVNVVSAAGEVGSGTAPAAAGKHFSSVSPTGYKVKEDSTISSFPSSTHVVQLSPRGKDGKPVDFDNLAREQMRQIRENYKDAIVVFHAVDGSKTGLKLPSHEVIEELQDIWGQHLVLVLDACQGRSDLEEYRWFLSKGALILLTGSKFFCGPGFCGSVLFSSSIMQELENLSSIPDGISFYITKNEVAESMPCLRSKLPRHPCNIGLLLRWECALTEMERFTDIIACNSIIDQWSYGVRSIIENHFSLIRVLVDEELTDVGVNSIINLIVHKQNGEVMNLNELRVLHKLLSSVVDSVPCSTQEGRIASLICLIGQPVKLGDKSVIRLALGASQIRAVYDAKCSVEDLLCEDWKILCKLQFLIAHLDEMV
ncbi:hypothetical protein GpartN1_g299.t1 [Galdieria partita]|uniref:Uncharacterized protein n=1 Tax=Galdieria partita TaxID=83374 RepID=A0A9C7PPW0_9RHOD|nr:hypothetical protein GpartN1_g299.t1 [Galdieria partita]